MSPPSTSRRLTGPCAGARGEGDRRLLVQALVRARLVVVRDVVGQDAAQVRLVDDEEVVEALRAHRADPALGVGVRRRRAVGRAHDLDPLGREHRVEGRRELGVAIVDEEAGRRARLLQRPGEVARLLRDPGGGRVGGAAGEVDAARADLEEEQDVQRLEEERLDGEEVAGQQLVLVAAR